MVLTRLLSTDNGVPTAWVSLDEQDEPGVLDSCIAFGCQGAGLDIADGPEPDEAGRGPESRAGFVLQAIAALGRPFVLAFDELERLANPASVALLDFLLQHAPGNLHLALACRHLPAGLNIAGVVLEGRAAVLTTYQLQFSRTEVAEFFVQCLSGSELDRLVAESAGWPFALRIARNGIQGGIGSNAGAVRGRCGTWSRTGWNRGCSRVSEVTTGISCSISACSTGSSRRGAGAHRFAPPARHDAGPGGADIQGYQRYTAPHRGDRINRQAPAMTRGRLQQNPDVDAAIGCSVQCVDDRGDVICDEADEEEATLRVTDEIQKHLLCATGGDEGCRRARPNEFDIALALRLLAGVRRADQDTGQYIA